MKKIHNIIYILTLVSIFFISYYLNADISDITAQNLVTLFSVIFGFYMTSIAILYNSNYLKKLYKEINEKEQKRNIQILISYIKRIGINLIFSIFLIVFFTICSYKNNNGILTTSFNSLVLPFIKKEIDLNLFFISFVYGVISSNIFYMILLLNNIIDGIMVEAKDE